MTGNRVAIRYARALFILSEEYKATEKVYQDILFVGSLLKSQPRLLSALHNPVLEESKKLSLLKELFSSHLTKMLSDFIDFLSAKNRLLILADICAEYAGLYKKSTGIIEAEVYSAVPFNNIQEKNITDYLSAQTGKTVILSKKVDRELIGGFAVRLEDKYYDNTLRSKLRKLSKTLINQ